MTITKADILMGRDKIEEVVIDGLPGPIPIRPLTDGQYAHIRQIKASGMKAVGKHGEKYPSIEFDLEESNKNRFRGDVKAVFYGLAMDEKWTEEEILSMRPPGIIEKIANEIYRISGVDEAEEIERFRPK